MGDNRYWGYGSYDVDDNNNENLGYTRYDNMTGRVDKFVDNGDGGHSHQQWSDSNSYNNGGTPTYNRSDSNSSGNPSTGSIQSSSGCYLTTACMKHMKDNFDDNCEELTILRWFRDNYVSEDDINHYYKTAPIIVDALEEIENSEIYNYIYEHIVFECVNSIKKGNYDFAYSRYKSSILSLEEKYVRSKLMNNISKTLKLKLYN